jgi:hypothetical protein
MSVPARNWANERQTGSRTAKAILLVLADAAKLKAIEGGRGQAHQCILARETIAARVECSVASVQRALVVLNNTGLVVRKSRHDKRGYNSSREFFLNVDNEPIETFAKRCGAEWEFIEWKLSPPEAHFELQATPRLKLILTPPEAHSEPASTLNRDLNREGVRAGAHARAKERSKATELPENWTPSEDLVLTLLREVEAKREDIEQIAKRFCNHYRHLAKHRNRKCANWPARFWEWCVKDLPAKKQVVAERKLADEAWVSHVRGWVEVRIWHPGIGPTPGQPGCRAPTHILAQFGLAPVDQAAPTSTAA